jgi:cobalamin biosynthesis protein CobW
MKIPATVITGFLGAGKTTLIRRLLEGANGRRIALIINEFGDLGIDADILKGCGIKDCSDDDVVELTNGCICCTVADDFLPTIEMLLDRPDPPDHIIIETSGLALPKPLVQAFRWPEIRSRVTVDGVVAVVDAPAVAAGRFADEPDIVQAAREADPALDHDSPLEEVFVDQLQCADLVVLNKADMIGENGLAAVQSDLAANLQAAVKVVPTVHGNLDVDVVLGLAAAVEDVIDARPSVHDAEEEHDHEDFDTFMVELGPIDDPAALETRMRAAAEAHDVLRMKGFLDVPGKDRRHVVQAVGGRIDGYYDRPWNDDETRASRLVVIGLKGFDQAAVEAALKE